RNSYSTGSTWATIRKTTPRRSSTSSTASQSGGSPTIFERQRSQKSRRELGTLEGDLYHDGKFVNRPEQQWQFAKCRCMPLVYELDVRGEQVLRDHGLPVHSSPLLTKGRMGVARQFAHQLMICDCLASIELGVRQNTALRFISWQEILAKAPKETCS